eukprot:5410834-Ditylum_brightwellii.AAC.1
METHPQNSVELQHYQQIVEEFNIGRWRYKSDGDLAIDDNNNNLLSSALCKAALCGSSTVQKYSEYCVEGLASDVTKLDVHCGVGIGKMAALHIGNDERRRKFLVNPT